MPDNETILAGCEVLCIPPESELVACPLSPKEMEDCIMRRQYEAGRKEVVDFIQSHGGTVMSEHQRKLWKAKIKEWGIKEVIEIRRIKNIDMVE